MKANHLQLAPLTRDDNHSGQWTRLESFVFPCPYLLVPTERSQGRAFSMPHRHICPSVFIHFLFSTLSAETRFCLYLSCYQFFTFLATSHIFINNILAQTKNEETSDPYLSFPPPTQRMFYVPSTLKNGDFVLGNVKCWHPAFETQAAVVN